MSKIVFKQKGWRALIADEFNFENVRIVTQALANHIKNCNLDKKSLLIAYDQRFMSKHFALECARVILGNGLRALMFNKVVPEGEIALAISKLGAAGSIVVTAGKFPAEYNGIKYIPAHAGPLSAEESDKIQQEIELVLADKKVYELDIPDAKDLGLFSKLDFDDEYMQQLAKMLNLISPPDLSGPVKVIIDPMFGSTIGYLEKLLKDIGCSVRTINNYRDPLFGGQGLSLRDENRLEALKSAVISHQAHIGIALDVNGTGFALIDADGSVISTNDFAVLLLDHWLETRAARGAVCRTLSTTHMLDKIARVEGLTVIETPESFAVISEEMREKTCILGVAGYGKIAVLGHAPYPDAILAGLLAVEMLLIHRGQTLADLKPAIKETYGWEYEVTEEFILDKAGYRQVSSLLADFNPIAIADLRVESTELYADMPGRKIMLENDSWILLQMYSDTGSIKIYSATPSEEISKELYGEVLKKLELQ